MMDWPAAWNDVAEVILHVMARNAKAIALYKKWGFEVTETKFDYYVGHTILKMVKQLTKSSTERKHHRE
jgi:ribosomal protein S18 acetylase RimI-like enzyme